MKGNTWRTGALLLTMALLAALLACLTYVTRPPAAAADSGGWTNFDNLGIDGDVTVGDDLTVTGDIAVDDLGITDDLDAGGDLRVTGAATITGTTTLKAETTIGGGYGSTGCTASAAGVLLCNGAITSDAALTAASAVIGGGYGSTGCTATAAGALSCDETIRTLNDVDIGDDLIVADQVLLGTTPTVIAGDGASIDGQLAITGWTNAAGGIRDSGGDLILGDATNITSTLDVDGAATFDADVTLTADTGGGNAGAKTEYVGIPRIRYVGFGAGTNGAAGGKTVDLDDDTPSGEFVATDADVTCTDNGTYYKQGANSLALAFSVDADAGDGCHDAVGPLDFTADESTGFWLRCSTTTVAGDLITDLTDDGGARQTNVAAVTANVWTWVEVALPGADADKDSISDISIELSAAGAARAAAAAFTCYVDAFYKWDSTEEDAIGYAIITDGHMGLVNVANGAPLVEYTDFFIHYEAGNDFAVWITDQSAAFITGLVAY